MPGVFGLVDGAAIMALMAVEFGFADKFYFEHVDGEVIVWTTYLFTDTLRMDKVKPVLREQSSYDINSSQ
ncbi:hypothetical protein TsFJ059_006119 [Trichoderma semiorbis]|uniref:Uncharacterized protein n=1 Tax=Trichoderma semiorbis TaxID=1491008 RepID=A0A9P8HB28_9HYPO|nr:hypothetical protein TsFJ059_006119 [Trichoderma semiorbis]